MPQNATNTSAIPNMPISLPKNTASSGTAAASTSITLLLRSSVMLPITGLDRNSVSTNTPNTAKKADGRCRPRLGAPVA